MSLLADDTITQLSFSVFENKGIYGLLLGSGLSRAADIPTGWEITLDLIRRVARAKGVAEQPDWAKWYREETGDEPNYSTLLSELAATPTERRAILHGYIEPSEEDREQGRKVPTTGHRAIARLVRGGYIKVIVTTNFDRLLENALREVGVEPTVIASPDALRGAEPIIHSSCYVLKLHGDYKDARIRNVDEELKDYPKAYNDLLGRIFDEHGLIVCGWSGEWDAALRRAILRAPNRRYSMWWMARSPVKTAAQDIIDVRKARIVTASDADAFFSALQQKVETLEQTRQKNPESIELLVSNAKRYLTKPEFRIQLDELVAQEGGRVLELINGEEFAPHGPTDVGALQTRVRRYEAISEGLVRVAGVLGRWGDGKELPLVLDLVRSLYADAEKIGGGLVFFLGMRSYPALLTVMSYGLGLVRAERWATLHQFLKAQIAREYREPRRLIDVLFIDTWKGDENEIWNSIAGTERRKTALDDYLLGQFTEWSKSFVGLVPDFERLYERFEFLGALAYLEQESEDTIKQAVENQAGYGAVRMPIGRLGWHSSGFEALVSEFNGEEFRKKLCAAGFGNGRTEFIELFLKNAAKVFARRSW